MPQRIEVGQGETSVEARENLEEAISLYPGHLLEACEPIPPGLARTFDAADISVRGESVNAKISTVSGCKQTRECRPSPGGAWSRY